MIMDYELAKELKEAGFPQRADNKSCFYWCSLEQVGSKTREVTPHIIWGSNGWVDSVLTRNPTLEELIEACGEDVTIRLQSYYNENDLHWQADTGGNFAPWDNERHIAEVGTTPTSAVARLWLALHKKQ